MDPVHDNSDSQPAETQSWCLRKANGALAWSTWLLSEEPLLVGRSMGCHVCIEDPSVSRVQCEIRLVNGDPVLRHRSRRTPTRVNGAKCTESFLRLGDVIEFAGHRLIVDLASQRAPVGFTEEDTPQTTQRFEDSVYLHPRLDKTDRTTAGGFTHDLVSLFSLQRSLGRSESLDELVDELRAHLSGHLGPGMCWLAWRVGAGDEIAFFPPVSNDEKASAPLVALRQAMASEEGVQLAIPGDLQTVALSAPLIHRGTVFGAIAIRCNAGSTALPTSHLHYLLAVAEAVAPLIVAAERMEQTQRDNRALGTPYAPHNLLIGSSAAIAELRATIARTAAGRNNVMLLGETGVGKELAARMIHELSARAAGPYVVVNCAAIPDDLFESEVFGHERGAFTGASQPRKGLFEQAHGGTLFLDEVGELSAANQARLLRAAETNTFRRVGAENELGVDVRIVSATNRPIPDSGISQGFRPDLFYRLAGAVLWIPPLRERPEDIPELARHFLAHYAPHAPARPITFSDDAMAALAAHAWPGNVRELRNVVEHACYTATSRVVSCEDLLALQAKYSSSDPHRSVQLEDMERNHLIEVLRAHDGNVAKSAEALGIAASTLYYKLKRHKIGLRNRF